MIPATENELFTQFLFMALEEAGNRVVRAPYPHAVVDDVLPDEVFQQLHQGLGRDTRALWEWNRYSAPFEEKLGHAAEDVRPGSRMRWLLDTLSMPEAAALMGWRVLGSADLVPDTARIGGGLSAVPSGGYLKLHTDANLVHTYPDRRRRLNLLYYWHPEWREEWGGHLELWPSVEHAGRWWPDGRAEPVRILPKPNRMVLIRADDQAFHGHPSPTTAPECAYRLGVQLFYFAPLDPALDTQERVLPTYCEPYVPGQDPVDYVARAGLRWQR